MAQEKVRVVIEIRGGNLQAVYTGNPEGVEVTVVDWDNIEAGDSAGIWLPDSEGMMSDETQALVEAARQDFAELRKIMAYGNQIGRLLGRAVTPAEARPFYNTGSTPEAAAHELSKPTLCECGRAPEDCATADDPEGEHGDR